MTVMPASPAPLGCLLTQESTAHFRMSLKYYVVLFTLFIIISVQVHQAPKKLCHFNGLS